MANWTGLAGASGLAAALEEIQNRRVREAQLQRELTSGQGEWIPGGGAGGALGFFDSLFGFNRPGEMGFGSQRYAFKPYDPVTPEQAKAWGMTFPETVTTPEYSRTPHGRCAGEYDRPHTGASPRDDARRPHARDRRAAPRAQREDGAVSGAAQGTA